MTALAVTRLASRFDQTPETTTVATPSCCCCCCCCLVTVAASVGVVSKVAANTATKHRRTTGGPVVLALFGLIAPWIAAALAGGAFDSTAAAWAAGVVALGAIYAGVAALAGGSPLMGVLGGAAMAVAAGALTFAEIYVVLVVLFSGPAEASVPLLLVWLIAAIAVFLLCMKHVRWPVPNADPPASGWPPAEPPDGSRPPFSL